MYPLQEIKDLEIVLLKGNFLELLNDTAIQDLIDIFPVPENEVVDEVQNQDFISRVLSKLTFNGSLPLNEKLLNVKKHIERVIQTNEAFAAEFVILLIGVSALQEFLKYNWTGPSVNESNFKCLSDFLDSSSLDTRKQVLDLLSRDSEHVYEHVKYPELLLVSDMMLSSLIDSSCMTVKWWRFRCLMMHQRVLLDNSMTLYKEMKLLATEVSQLTWVTENSLLKLQLLVEMGHMHLYYHEITPAKAFFSEAQDVAGIEVELSGAFGKRTQFQQKPVAQLVVKLKRNKSLPECDTTILQDSDLPCDAALQDDLLLNKIQFIDISDNAVEQLHPAEQLCLLAQCCLLQKSEACDELLNEKLIAYVDCLLQQKKVWSLQFKILFMRCKLEKNKSRKIERAMAQVEALLSAIKKETPDVFIRQNLFYSASFPPYWILEKELADTLLSLGAVKSALEIYQRLELWEDIVRCYYILDRNDQAATIIREKLAEKETPTLWCLLGDVTDDIHCYEKAWELSAFKSARSQFCLGYYYYRKTEYKTCVPYFKKSLELNHLQSNAWFSLGFAASQTGDHGLAAQAYRHVVSLNPEHFEAWNNLSSAYIKLQQKERAYKTLQEALKCNYEDWRVWENYLLVCVDIGAFEDVIQTCHRILDIKGKFEDVEVLKIIEVAISTDVLDFTGQKTMRLKKKALQLFGRITAAIPNNGEVWKSYAALHLADPECRTNAESMAVVIKYLQKAVNCTIQKPHSLRDVPACKIVISDSCALADAYLDYFKLIEGDIKMQSQAHANLTLRNTLVRIEKQLRTFQFDKDDEELEENVKLLKNKINFVKEQI